MDGRKSVSATTVLGAEAASETIEDSVRIGEYFKDYGVIPASLPGLWPRFRGANSDNVCIDNVPLADKWKKTGPPVLWSIDLGEGYAGPVVRNSRVFLLDYDENTKSDALRCFSLQDGREIWRRSYRVHVKRNHGMSRTAPAVSERYVVTMGPRCHVMCVRADTGSFLWGMDLVRDFGASEPLWYTGQCPLIDDNIAVIAVGGDALLLGVDCETGQIVWETPNPKDWKMSHSSIMPMVVGGREMYVYCAIGGIIGVSANESDTGTVLWETSEWSPRVAAPSPVPFKDGRIFVTAGYGAGSMMLQINKQNHGYSANVLYSFSPKQGLACEQHTPILYQGHLFGVLPEDAGSIRKQFACFHPDGHMIWKSGKTNRFGLGPFIAADEKFYILSDDGVLTMIRGTVRGYEVLDRAKVLEGPDAWAPMAIAGGRMLLRDYKRMVCIDVRAQ